MRLKRQTKQIRKILMVRQLVNRFLSPKPKSKTKRALLLVFDHPVAERCVLHHPDEQHMLLGKGDGALTAARFYLKPYFKYLTDIDLHYFQRGEFTVDGVEYDTVHFDFPVVCDQEKALSKLIRERHQFIPIDQHRFAGKLQKVLKS